MTRVFLRDTKRRDRTGGGNVMTEAEWSGRVTTQIHRGEGNVEMETEIAATWP